MKPVKHKGDATGGPTTPFEKSMDRPFPSYLNNETNPRDDFHAEPRSEGTMDNSGDMSKKFGLPRRTIRR
jgi:hypothetical protein